jgi:crotonobetainyl-CoA:carnitine CoA-transferase CaiB-like acyl-CoA transferase
MFVDVPFGKTSVEVFGSPIKLSGTPPRTNGVVPELGQHNHEVYVQWLGITPERYEVLCNAGVI